MRDQSSSERLIKSWHGFEKLDSEDSGIEEEFEVLDSESQEIPATPCSTSPEDLSLENAILANFPDGCDRSFTVELKDEDSYSIIPKNLTFAEIINILNQAIQEDNCEELDKAVQNIEDYEGRSITLDSENLKDFCSNQLNLELQNRSNHQHIHSNVLSRYKSNQEGFKRDYSVKELVLLAIAANDKLVEQYKDFLFAEENLSLLPLLVGNQKYIEAFIEKFHGTDGVYGRLKGQAIQLVEPDKIGFFSVIALRKEQKLLETVFVKYVLRDFGQVLKTSKPDPLYGVLETASLIENEEFITIVLDAFERYINEPTKKASTEELLKKSFATLLEAAISQERISVIESLCKRYTRYTNSADHAIYDVYEQAFADDKVITRLEQQILKNIGVRGRKEIYDLILNTALYAGNIAFIEHLCEKRAECRNDVINCLDHKLKNNEFDNAYKSALIVLSNVEYTNVIAKVLFYTEEIHQNVSHNEQVIRQVIQNILKNATHYSIGQEDYSLVKKVCKLCTEIDAINVIFQEECEIFKSSIEKRIEDLEKENKLLQSKALREYNSRYLPGIVNGLAQIAYIAYDEYTKDPKDNKPQKNIDLIFSLMQIRNILQFSIDVQEYPCHKRQDLWNEMYQTPGTFIIRKGSNNVADELEIPVITSDILSENPGLESVGSQQPQKNVDKGKNIIDNEEASIEEAIDNDYRVGKMHENKNSTKSATTSSHEAPVNVESESKGDQQGSPPLLPQSSVSGDVEGTEASANAAVIIPEKVDSLVSDGEHGKIVPKEHQDDVLGGDFSSDDGNISVDSDEVFYDAENHPGDPVPTSTNEISGRTDDTQTTPEQLEEPISPSVPPTVHVSQDDINVQLSNSTPAVTATRSSTPTTQVVPVPAAPVPPVTSKSSGQEGNVQINGKQSTNPSNIANASSDFNSKPITKEPVATESNQQSSKPPLSSDDEKEPLLDKINKGDSTLKSSNSPQSTKSIKLPTVATWTLAVAGILAGVSASVAYFAFGASLLVVGITAGVGACCLVAAAIMYCFNSPSNSLENSNTEAAMIGDHLKP